MHRPTLIAAALLAALPLALAPVAQAEEAPDRKVRFSTFNASLNRNVAGQLVADLSTPDNVQAQNVAETVQRVRPDVLLVNEFDYAPEAVDLFRDNYLEVSHHGSEPIDYPYAYIAPSNTGVPSGHDLDNNGSVGGGNDAFGFGLFEGQYGMVVYSKHPIDTDAVRTFQTFRWADMPGAMLPDDPATPEPADWYSAAELGDVRLSSKSHWDVPIDVDGSTIHFLVSHPTPPVFDGAEDRNGTRNHDEIRFWADYVSSDAADSAYIYDDAGVYGGLPASERFVIAGDQNSDPLDGDSVPGSAQQLLDHPRVNDAKAPASVGGTWAAELQGAANLGHESHPRFDTADFDDRLCCGPGNLRADYVLPSTGLRVLGSGIFWPTEDQKFYYLTGSFPFVPTSDHRQVWVDLRP
ncbi:ABC sugar transporter [Nocardioides sp. CF8]|uniref:endonuclease/exonuclease/phosphatase family protein n=1 Tax=Nocardioides sp. CF8 TaxID=110319 RepID=UPI00033007B3|nr:endonuclease/exonuclease/phosphatase family protein [Nocardioides sp. CF8]EON24662.1 ABC sugar transporter [Nocardioides sp. CF8]